LEKNKQRHQIGGHWALSCKYLKPDIYLFIFFYNRCEMLIGYPVYYNHDWGLMFDSIVEDKVIIPKHYNISKEGENFLK
jgi:hypothetical protein